MNQKGNLAYAFFYIILFVMLSFIFIFFTPMAQNLTVQFFTVSETLVGDSNTTINQIQDVPTKEKINTILSDQKDNYVFQIDLLGSLNKWAAVIILVISVVSLVLLTRVVVQRQTGVT